MTSPQVTNEAVERARKAFRDEAAKWDYACNFAGQTFVFRRLDGAERLTPYECYARRRFSEAYAVPDGHSYVELLERKRDTAALTAALSAMPGQEWMPIESAPKDGREVLLLLPDPNDPGKWWRRISWWDGRFWVGTAGARHSPTGWQPLPTPPTAQEG